MRPVMASTPNDGNILKSKLLLFFTSFLTFSRDKRERHCYNAIAEIHIVQSGECNFYIGDAFDVGLNHG